MAQQREFSYPVRIDPWPAGGVTFQFEAEPDERRALAVRLGLDALEHFAAAGGIERAGAVFVLEARLVASVVQTCVVTLEPFEQRFDEVVRLDLRRGPDPDDALVEPDAVDTVFVTGSHVDLGQVFSEELALRLDPHPRAPGADVAALDAPFDVGDVPADDWRAALARHRPAVTG